MQPKCITGHPAAGRLKRCIADGSAGPSKAAGASVPLMPPRRASYDLAGMTRNTPTIPYASWPGRWQM